MNAEGARVEQRLGRPILARLHGGASAGTACGGDPRQPASRRARRRGPPASSPRWRLAARRRSSRSPIPSDADAPGAGGGRRTRRAVLAHADRRSDWLSASPSPARARRCPGRRCCSRRRRRDGPPSPVSARRSSPAARRRCGSTSTGCARASTTAALIARFARRRRGRAFCVVAAHAGFAASVFGFAIIGFGTGAVVPCGFALAASRPGVSAGAAISAVAVLRPVSRACRRRWSPAPSPTRFRSRPRFSLLAGLLLAAFAASFSSSRERTSSARSIRS